MLRRTTVVKTGKDCVMTTKSGVSLTCVLGLERTNRVLFHSCLCSVELCIAWLTLKGSRMDQHILYFQFSLAMTCLVSNSHRVNKWEVLTHYIPYNLFKVITATKNSWKTRICTQRGDWVNPAGPISSVASGLENERSKAKSIFRSLFVFWRFSRLNKPVPLYGGSAQ